MGGGGERIATGDAEPPTYPLAATARNALTQNQKRIVEEKGCPQLYELGAFFVRPPNAPPTADADWRP